MYIITRLGSPKKYISETNSNFAEIFTTEALLTLDEDDTLTEYCTKVNHNFNLSGVECSIYPQMQIDYLFERVTYCFRLIKPNADYIQT